MRQTLTARLFAVCVVVAIGCTDTTDSSEDAPDTSTIETADAGTTNDAETDVIALDIGDSKVANDVLAAGDAALDAAADETVDTSDGGGLNDATGESDVRSNDVGSGDTHDGGQDAVDAAKGLEDGAVTDALADGSGSGSIDGYNVGDAVGGDGGDASAFDSGGGDATVADVGADSGIVACPNPDAQVAFPDASSFAGKSALGKINWPSPGPQGWPKAAFKEVTQQFVSVDGEKDHGFCTTAADFDGDGRIDLATIRLAFGTTGQVSLHVRIYLLKKGAKPKLVVTKVAPPNFSTEGICASADLDADGNVDLLIGGAPGIAFLSGNGKGGFDIGSHWALPGFMDFVGFSMVPGDFDRDGDLDLFVGAGLGPDCNWVQTCAYSESNFACKPSWSNKFSAVFQDRMFIRGPKLPLTDETAKWKLAPGGPATLGALVDLDLDGKVDLLVSDDFGPPRWLRNTGNGFVSHGTDVGFEPFAHGMGWGPGDFDGDGRWDIAFADTGPHPLYIQATPTQSCAAPALFVDRGKSWRMWEATANVSGWNPIAADFDHDGRDDIYLGASALTHDGDLANIAVCKKPGGYPVQRDIVLMNKAGKSFVPHQGPPISQPKPNMAFVAQTALDMDGDGDLDVAQVHANGRLRVLRNDTKKSGGFVIVRLTGTKGNTMAAGAWLRAKAGSRTMLRHIGATGFGGAGWWFAHFGLGAATKIDELQVHWPTGKTTVVKNLKAGTELVIKHP